MRKGQKLTPEQRMARCAIMRLVAERRKAGLPTKSHACRTAAKARTESPRPAVAERDLRQEVENLYCDTVVEFQEFCHVNRLNFRGELIAFMQLRLLNRGIQTIHHLLGGTMPGIDIAKFRTVVEYFHCPRCEGAIDPNQVHNSQRAEKLQLIRTTLAQCEHCNIVWTIECVLVADGWRPLGNPEIVTDRKVLKSFSSELAKRLGIAA